jgi:hypothetical protein
MYRVLELTESEDSNSGLLDDVVVVVAVLAAPLSSLAVSSGGQPAKFLGNGVGGRKDPFWLLALGRLGDPSTSISPILILPICRFPKPN